VGPHKLLRNTAATAGDISSSWQLLEEQKLLSGHVTFSRDAPFSLFHPSACLAPPSELCPCRELHLRIDPSETEAAAPQQDFFFFFVSVCVFANHIGSMIWY